jgi:cardiolipin synthase (CMP-forming)
MVVPSDRGGARRHLTIPNILSLIRLGMIPLFIVLALRGHHAAAFFVFVGAALTDALDGYLARRLNQASRLGAFLDPAADKLLMVSGYIVYTITSVATWTLPIWLTFTVFIRDLTLVVFAYLIYTRVHIKRFPPSLAGKISTIVQVVVLAATIAANTFIAPLTTPMLLWLHRLALVMTLYSGADYLRRWEIELRRG